MNLDPKTKRLIGWIIVVVAIIAAGFLGVTYPIPPMPTDEMQALGNTHFSGLAISAPTTQPTGTPAAVVDSAGVSKLFDVRDGGSSVFSVHDGGDVSLGSTYPLEYASANRLVYVGLTSAFTGTTTVPSTTHGCTNDITMVLCTMTAPDDDAGDAAYCVGSVSDGDITLSALQDSGDAATEVDTQAYYIIVGY